MRGEVALLLLGAALLPSLTVDVRNVRNARGTVRVDICPKDYFLRDGCPYSGTAAAHPGVTSVTIRGVPAGRYAAQAFHDENADGEVDRALFGIPREGVGFSRDARIRLSPPRWEEAVFTTDGSDDRIGFSLRYFLGPAGPGPR